MSVGEHESLISRRLAGARVQLGQATDGVADAAPAPGELYSIVDGTMQTICALAEVLAALRRQAPQALTGHHEQLARELEYDLRAAHGCLTTAPRLLAPARDDLAALADACGAGVHDDHTGKESAMVEDATDADRVDQHQLARPEPVDDELAIEELAEVLEADPADVAEQHRDAPVLGNNEPWPLTSPPASGARDELGPDW